MVLDTTQPVDSGVLDTGFERPLTGFIIISTRRPAAIITQRPWLKVGSGLTVLNIMPTARDLL